MAELVRARARSRHLGLSEVSAETLRARLTRSIRSPRSRASGRCSPASSSERSSPPRASSASASSPTARSGAGELTGAVEITADDDFRRSSAALPAGQPRAQPGARSSASREMAAELGCTPAQLALAWLLAPGRGRRADPGDEARRVPRGERGRRRHRARASEQLRELDERSRPATPPATATPTWPRRAMRLIRALGRSRSTRIEKPSARAASRISSLASRAARLQHQLDGRLAHVQVDAVAQVLDVDHVAAVVGHHPQQARQRAGPVGHDRRQHHPAAGGRLAQADALRQQRGVDVAARQHRADVAAARAAATRPCISAATATAPAPSTTSFERSSSSTIASRHLVVRDRHDLVHVALDQRQREVARALDRDAVADRVRRARPDRPVGRERVDVGAQASAWTPTTRAPGSHSDAASAMPLASPPPPSGTTTSCASGAWRAISSPTVPWPATTSAGRRRARASGPPASARRARLGARVVVAALDEAHLAAVLAHRGDLRERRLLGHHEHGAARPRRAPRRPPPGRGCPRWPRPPRRAAPPRAGGRSCWSRRAP